MTSTKADWVHDYYAAWDAGDAGRIAEWFSHDVVLEDVPTGHVALGEGEARAFVAAALVKVPGARYEVVSSQMSGDEFAVEWVMHPVGLRGASVGLLRDGKVAINRDYWSAGSFRQ